MIFILSFRYIPFVFHMFFLSQYISKSEFSKNLCGILEMQMKLSFLSAGPV